MLGDNQNGQLGDGTAKPVRADRILTDAVLYSSEPYLAMKKAASVSIRENIVTAVDFSGKEYVWGEGYGAWPKEVEDRVTAGPDDKKI